MVRVNIIIQVNLELNTVNKNVDLCNTSNLNDLYQMIFQFSAELKLQL